MKRLLIVSPHFPPVAAPDMQRVRMSLAHYRDSGWEPVVLAVHPADVAAPKEPELLATFPDDIEVHRCRAWPRRFGLGTVALRALQPLHHEGVRLLGHQTFDLVFFSTTQFMVLPLGRRWRRRFGIPYVIDIQDPWRTDAYDRPGAPRPPGGWKYRFARLLAWWFEERCFRAASGFVSVSPRYLQDLTARYPWFHEKPQAVIEFGATPADLAAAARLPLPQELPARAIGEVRFTNTGAAGPMLPHAADCLFSALARYRQENPEKARRLRFLFLGTQYAPPGQAKSAVVPVAARHGVADLVFELPHRLGYLQSLRCLLEADALLLPGSVDPAYSPSKLYPYYLTGKPMLGIVLRDSHLERLFTELNCAHLARFLPSGSSEGSDTAIAAFLEQMVARSISGAAPLRNDLLFRQAYGIEELTRRQCDVFSQALAAR